MTNTRVNEIDLLRFLAAIAVVFFHYSFRGYAADDMSVMPYPLFASASKYGYLGVELFFMISGFVILMTAASGSLRGFVISRIVRLYPAFWVCCTITFLLTITIGGARYTASIGQYLANMTMLSGFTKIPSIDGAYWSLFIEIRFYLLVAIVLLVGKIHKAQTLTLAWLVLTIILEIKSTRTLRNFFITEYSAFFIAGATFFFIWEKGLSNTRIAMIITSWALAVFKSTDKLDVFEKHYATPISSYVVAGIVTLFFVLMALASLRRTGFIGRHQWLLAGVLTYPLYLLHQNIGFMVFNLAYPQVNAHILFWGMILVVIAIAYAVHFFIEKRFASPMKRALNTLTDFGQQKLSLVRSAIEQRRGN
ncbi:MAG: acyltransferase [Pseudomonadales bacterium]